MAAVASCHEGGAPSPTHTPHPPLTHHVSCVTVGAPVERPPPEGEGRQLPHLPAGMPWWDRKCKSAATTACQAWRGRPSSSLCRRALADAMRPPPTQASTQLDMQDHHPTAHLRPCSFAVPWRSVTTSSRVQVSSRCFPCFLSAASTAAGGCRSAAPAVVWAVVCRRRRLVRLRGASSSACPGPRAAVGRVQG